MREKWSKNNGKIGKLLYRRFLCCLQSTGIEHHIEIASTNQQPTATGTWEGHAIRRAWGRHGAWKCARTGQNQAQVKNTRDVGVSASVSAIAGVFVIGRLVLSDHTLFAYRVRPR